jgi:hypothetical protein
MNNKSLIHLHLNLNMILQVFLPKVIHDIIKIRENFLNQLSIQNVKTVLT